MYIKKFILFSGYRAAIFISNKLISINLYRPTTIT